MITLELKIHVDHLTDNIRTKMRMLLIPNLTNKSILYDSWFYRTYTHAIILMYFSNTELFVAI